MKNNKLVFVGIVGLFALSFASICSSFKSSAVSVLAVLEAGTQQDPWLVGAEGHENEVVAYLDGTKLVVKGEGNMCTWKGTSDIKWPIAKGSITEIVVEDGVTSMTPYFATTIQGINKVSIGKDVKSIGDFAFRNSFSDYTIVFAKESKLQSLGQQCFTSSWFTTIELPDSLTSIGRQCFSGCSKLTDITLNSINPPTTDSGLFSSCYELTNIYVPAASVDAYKSATGWRDYSSKIEALPGKEINNLAPESDKDANDGYISIQSKASNNDSVEVGVYPNEGCHLDDLSYTKSVMGNAVNNYTNLPDEDVFDRTYNNIRLFCLDKEDSLFRISNFLETGANMDFYWDRTTDKITLLEVIDINYNSKQGSPMYVTDAYQYYNTFREVQQTWENIVKYGLGNQSYYQDGVFHFSIKFMIPDEKILPLDQYAYTYTPSEDITNWPTDATPITKDSTSGKYTFTMPSYDISVLANFSEHDYSDPVYTWSEDFGTCTGTKECSGCDDVITETVNSSFHIDTPATCTTPAKGHYEASFTNTNFETQKTPENSREVPESELGHDLTNISYNWVGDKCTATGECSTCGNDVTETVTGVYVKDTPATCLENEKGHFEATFVNPDFENQSTDENSFEKQDSALGHDFGGEVTYTWNEETHECTASHKCQREDCTETQTETVVGVYVKDTDATTESNEKGHYEATFTIDAFEKQSTAPNSVEVPNSKLAKGLNGGAIAGIVVGAVVGAALISYVVMFVVYVKSGKGLKYLFKSFDWFKKLLKIK